MVRFQDKLNQILGPLNRVGILRNILCPNLKTQQEMQQSVTRYRELLLE